MELKMKTPLPAKGEAMPANKPTDQQIIEAMADIEIPICDLTYMAHITADVFERLFEQPASSQDGTMVYHVSKSERDAALFALNDIEDRTLRLKAQYMSGRYGEHA
jgi:hypothetical protein